jgi:Pyruvate/2-oxoacid:ferredoxin oxidoreductase delta subunit
MRPEDKAKALYEAMYYKTSRTVSENNKHETAKSCALFCCDEIIAAIDFDWMEVQNLDREHAYWQAVKRAIQNI